MTVTPTRLGTFSLSGRNVALQQWKSPAFRPENTLNDIELHLGQKGATVDYLNRLCRWGYLTRVYTNGPVRERFALVEPPPEAERPH